MYMYIHSNNMHHPQAYPTELNIIQTEIRRPQEGYIKQECRIPIQKPVEHSDRMKQAKQQSVLPVVRIGQVLCKYSCMSHTCFSTALS